MNEFQKKAERIITEALQKEGFQITNRKIYAEDIFLDVNDMTIIIMGMEAAPETQNQLVCERDLLRRGTEILTEIQDKQINNFVRCLIYYLRHPEYNDKVSLTDWRSTCRWIARHILSMEFLDDADKLERNG